MTVDGNALAEYTYVGLGRVRTRKVYNTPGTTTLHSDLRVNYLANARVVHQYLNTMTGGPQTNIAKYEYGYDNVYNQTSKKDLLAPSGQQYEAYNYDNLYRLTGVKYGANASATTYDRSTVFNLDIVGNREGTSGVVEDADGSGSGTPVSIPYASNEVNEYNTAGSANPLHDAYGNLTFDGANTYTFDHNDRLKTVNGTGIEYDYDALGRRLTKTVGSITTRYYYSGWRCIQERNAADVIVAEYIHGNNLDEVLQMKRGGCTYTYHTDAQGNVVAISDATGRVIEKIKYDVYGRLTEFKYWNGAGYSDGDANSDGFVSATEYYACSLTKNPYLFQGRRLDEESGLYYFRNRYYDPVHGRFISRDPEGFVDGPNLYAFVNNNPINYVDPWGLLIAERDISLQATAFQGVGVSAGMAIDDRGDIYLTASMEDIRGIDVGAAVQTSISISKGTCADLEGYYRSTSLSVSFPGGLGLSGGVGQSEDRSITGGGAGVSFGGGFTVVGFTHACGYKWSERVGNIEDYKLTFDFDDPVKSMDTWNQVAFKAEMDICRATERLAKRVTKEAPEKMKEIKKKRAKSYRSPIFYAVAPELTVQQVEQMAKVEFQTPSGKKRILTKVGFGSYEMRGPEGNVVYSVDILGGANVKMP